MNTGMNPNRRIVTASCASVDANSIDDFAIHKSLTSVSISAGQAATTYSIFGKTADETIDLLCEALQAAKTTTKREGK
jgi:hypothetical protein